MVRISAHKKPHPLATKHVIEAQMGRIIPAENNPINHDQQKTPSLMLMQLASDILI